MALPSRNGKVEIESPTDEHVRQCARSLKEPSSVKSIELRRGTITGSGAGVLARALRGEYKVFLERM